jgi:hypothetical protein
VSPSYASAHSRRPLAHTVGTRQTREWLMPQPRWSPRPGGRSVMARRRADGPQARMPRLGQPAASPCQARHLIA